MEKNCGVLPKFFNLDYYVGDMMILCGRSFSILADSEVIWA